MGVQAGGWLLHLPMVVIFLTSTIAAARAEQVSALGQKHDGIIVASDPNRGPNFTRDMVDALNRIDPSLRLHVKDGYASLRRVDIDLALGDIDAFFGLRKSDDRTKVMNFLDEVPLYCIDYRLAVRMEEQAEPRSFDDVRALGGNAVILAIQGRLYAHLLKQQPDLSVDDGSVSAEANLQKLLDHRGRFFYADSQLLKYAIQKLGLETSVRILPTIFESDVIYAVTSKFLDPELARNFRTAVQSMEQNGELATIRAKNNVAIYKSGRGQGSVCAH